MPEFKKHNPGCNCCAGAPSNCCDDTINPRPATITATVSGVTGTTTGKCASDGHTCSGQYNYAWSLSLQEHATNDFCWWEATRTIKLFTTTGIQFICADITEVAIFQMYNNNSGDWILNFFTYHLANTGTGAIPYHQVSWTKNIGTTQPDCGAFLQTLNFESINDAADDPCDFSSSQVDVST